MIFYTNTDYPGVIDNITKIRMAFCLMSTSEEDGVSKLPQDYTWVRSQSGSFPQDLLMTSSLNLLANKVLETK